MVSEKKIWVGKELKQWNGLEFLEKKIRILSFDGNVFNVFNYLFFS